MPDQFPQSRYVGKASSALLKSGSVTISSKRHSRPVEIEIGITAAVIMHTFTGILFDMYPVDTDLF
jgi:hypothetical protein